MRFRKRFRGSLALVLAGSAAFAATPESLRVVSLSQEASEVLLRIGARNTLVAVDEESRSLDGLAFLPVATLATAAEVAPDLVVVPSLEGEAAQLAETLRGRGIDLIEFAPHDFDDAFELCRMLGIRLGLREQARTFVREHSRELARISSSSTGQRRPRVAGVVELNPFVVAGGHSFVTDLIQIAGAESVTHGTHESRTPMSPDEILALRPELVVVVRAEGIPEPERNAVRGRLGGVPRVAFLSFDPRRVWLRDPVEVARQLRALVVGGLDD